MSPQRFLSRSFSADGRSSNHWSSDRHVGERSDSYLHTVRPESRSTLHGVLAQLTELTQPMFDITLKSKAVSETSNVKFSCVVSGYPAPDVTWYKDDLQLDKYCSLPKYEIIHEGKNHILHIYSCSSEDAAIYQVSARNSQGIVSCSGVLEVGTMNEYQIHQNYFAKLKQKAKSRLRGLEETRRPEKENVPDDTEAMSASSSERCLRKRRTSTGTSVSQTATASPEQLEVLQNHAATAVATGELDSYAPEPSAASVNAVSGDETFSNKDRLKKGEGIVSHNLVNGVNFTSNTTPGMKKIKISAEEGERAREDRQVETEQKRKKETERGEDRNPSKAMPSLSSLEERMEVDSHTFQPKATAELRSTSKEVKTEQRLSEKRTGMALANRGKTFTKPPPALKQPVVKVSSATKTETTTRPIVLKKSIKEKRENSLSAVPPHLPGVKPQSRAVKQPLTSNNRIDLEGTAASRPEEPLSDEPGASDSGQVSSRTSVVKSECREAPGGLSSGVSEELALGKHKILPHTGGRITVVKDTSGRNGSIPYTTNTAAKDHIPVHMETATFDNRLPYHRETCTELKLQPSDEVREDNMGKPSSYKHITNQKYRHPIGSKKCSPDPGMASRQKGQEVSLVGENTPPGLRSLTQQQGQVMSTRNSSQADAKEKEQELGNRMIEEHRIGNKSTTPAVDTLRKPQQHGVDVSVTKKVCVNKKPETQDTFVNNKGLTPNICTTCQVVVTESQLFHPSNIFDSKAGQVQTQASTTYASQSTQAANIQANKKIPSLVQSTIPAADKNEKRAPGKSSREYEEEMLVENDFAKTGSEACFPPVCSAPAGKPPKPETSAPPTLQSSHQEMVIPAIYVTDMDSTQENNGTNAITHKSPDFKNKNKSPKSSLANVSITKNEQTNSILNQIGQMFKQADTVVTESSAPTAKTLPGLISERLSLKPSEVNGSYQPQENSLNVNESLTVLSPQSADTAGSGPVTDNNTRHIAEDSTTAKLTGAGETTNIALVMRNFTRLNLVDEHPACSQQSSPSLKGKHVPQPLPASDLIQYREKVAQDLEVKTDAAVPQNHALTAPEKSISPEAEGREINVQIAGDTELNKVAPQQENLPPQEAPCNLAAQTHSPRSAPEPLDQDVTLTFHNQECVQGSGQRPRQLSANERAESAAADKQSQQKAPQVIRKIRPEISDASGNIRLWCQFFNVLCDSTLRWYKDDVEIAEMKRSAGDESQVSLAVVQMSTRDCGLYRCTITNEYGTDFTDFLLTSESLSNLVLCEDSPEVGEEVEMTPLLFGKGLSGTGYWGNKFFGRILTEEAEVGTGCEHKTTRANVIYGLDPVFDSGSSCLIKVQSPIAYSGREEISLAERNIQLTKQACKIQNLARTYCKVFATQTRMIENFGSELEILPLYFIYRPARNIPYATVEVELNGVYLQYCGLDKTGSLVVRERSEIAQKCSSFQHWLHQRTSGNLLFTRLEGVDTIMTNIGISVKSEGYQGFPCKANSVVFENFQSQHRCNYFCGLLGLRPLKVPEQRRAAVQPKGSQSPQVPRLADRGLSPQTQRKTFNNQR